MLDVHLEHVEKPSIFSCLFFSCMTYYFKSWKRFWSIKNVYKMKREVERRFLHFRGFGWKFSLAWNFYGHNGISMPIYLSKFGDILLDVIHLLAGKVRSFLTGSLQCKQWNDFESFYIQWRKCRWVPFCCCGLQWRALVLRIPVWERASQGLPTWQAFVCSEERQLGAQGQGVADRTW